MIGAAGLLPYAGIFVAAIVEGEVAYVAASTLVAHGVLSAGGVIAAGAAGASVGDQIYFYVLRHRLPRWVARFPRIAAGAEPLVARVRRHPAAMVMLIRFAPGLRIALAAACAYADVSPVLFSVLNGATAVVWAIALLAVVAWAGPAYLSAIGLSGWQAALAAGVVILAVFHILGRIERRALTPR